MKIVGQARDYWQFCRLYRRFLSRTISLSEARDIVRHRLEHRGDQFLHMVREHVFSNPQSPYLPLMRLAGCEAGDLEKMVASDGLDATLQALRREGVYIAFDEYKGRKPLVRNGREIAFQPEDFWNRKLSGMLHGQSGGSTGAARRIAVHIDHLASQSPARMLSFDAHGIRDHPYAIWLGVLPDSSGPNVLLRPLKYGQVARRWFANVVTCDRLKPRIKARLYNSTIVLLGRLSGVPIPWPQPVSLDQAGIVAQWVARKIRSQGHCVLLAHTSKGVRVALAARQAGLDLSGATFVLAGEPVTPGKVAAVAAVGAVTVPMYAFAEHGEIGIGCAHPVGVDEVHLFEDTLAFMQAPRQVPGHDITVNSFHWTSLNPTAPNILLNLESDDYGVVEQRDCGCALHAIGYRQHLREIRSFQKMTGEGVTLIRSDAIRVLEEVLPARFGGSPLDYQLVEEEDERGMTVVHLVIDPSVPITSESQVIETFLEATGYEGLRRIWSPGQALRIKRQKPILTGAGKLMPLHLGRGI